MRHTTLRISLLSLALSGMTAAFGAQSAPQVVPPPVAPPSVVSAAAPAARVPAQPQPATAPAAAGATQTPARTASSLTLPTVPVSRLARPAPVPASHAKRGPDPFAGISTTPVSDSQLNRFVFPEPIEGVYFQEGAPLPDCPQNASETDLCHPVFLNGRRVMLLQLRAGAEGPVQMLVHLHSGRFLTMNLNPVPGPGAVVRADGAEDGASDERLAKASARTDGPGAGGMQASEQYVDLLARFARGEIPTEFESETPGKPVRFPYFDIIPMAAWSDGDRTRVHLFKVRALGDTPVKVSSTLFKAPNIKALALDRDTITYKEPALLYAVEILPEAQ